MAGTWQPELHIVQPASQEQLCKRELSAAKPQLLQTEKNPQKEAFGSKSPILGGGEGSKTNENAGRKRGQRKLQLQREGGREAWAGSQLHSPPPAHLQWSGQAPGGGGGSVCGHQPVATAAPTLSSTQSSHHQQSQACGKTVTDTWEDEVAAQGFEHSQGRI